MIDMEEDVDSLFMVDSFRLIKANVDNSIFFGDLKFDFEGCACVIQNHDNMISKSYLPPINYADKIAYEFCNWKTKNLQNSTFKVGIIGEIAYGKVGVLENVKEFAEYLLALIDTNSNKKYKIDIDFYTNTFGDIGKFCALENDSVSIEICLHEYKNEFFNAFAEDALLQNCHTENFFTSEHNLILFIDCARMYQFEEYKLNNSGKIEKLDEKIWNKNCETANFDIIGYYIRGIAYPKNLFCNSKSNRFRTFVRKEIFNAVTNGFSSDKRVYVFNKRYNLESEYSDYTRFDYYVDLDSDRNRCTFVTYNGVNGFVGHILSSNDTQYELTNPQKTIVFSLYDVLKVTNTRVISEDVLRKLFYKDTSKNAVTNVEVIKHLKGIYIGMKYDLKERGMGSPLNFLVYCDKTCFEDTELLIEFERIQKNVIEFVKGLFEDYLFVHNIAYYYNRRKCFLYSIILKHSMSVEDMFFLHFMTDKNFYFDAKLKFEISETDISTLYVNSEGIINPELALYRYIIETSDQSPNTFIMESEFNREIKKRNMSHLEVCTNIKNLCKKCDYSGSYLAENMDRWLKDFPSTDCD